MIAVPSEAPELVAGRLVADLAEWRTEHPGWTQASQHAAFPSDVLWGRVNASRLVGDFDWPLYARLREIAGNPPEDIA